MTKYTTSPGVPGLAVLTPKVGKLPLTKERRLPVPYQAVSGVRKTNAQQVAEGAFLPAVQLPNVNLARGGVGVDEQGTVAARSVPGYSHPHMV